MNIRPLAREMWGRRTHLVIAFSMATVVGFVIGTLAVATASVRTIDESHNEPVVQSVTDRVALTARESGTSVSNAKASTTGGGGCPYLNRYLAPFELPVDERPVSMVGPGPDVIEPREVGPTACDVVFEERIENVHGVPYRRVILGVSGELFGFTSYPNEPRPEQFAEHFLMVAPVGQRGPFRPGVYRYSWSPDTPAENEIVFPENAADWNGKLWVLAHGVSYYSDRAEFFDREPGVFNRYMNQSNFAAALIDEGYAIAHTRRGGAGRNSTQPSESAVLDDGTVVGGPGEIGMALNGDTAILRDYTVMAQNYLADQLGTRPEATFFRGHSAGGTVGRAFNTVPGLNVNHQGEKLFDGIYVSDTAAGRGPLTWNLEAEVGEGGVVELVESDTDSLTFDQEHRALMAKSVETMHEMYAGPDWDTPAEPEIARRVPASYRQLKKENARILVEKDLLDVWRFYEIADVGHDDAAGNRNAWPENAAEMVDIGGVSIALIRALDNWATNGVEPPGPRVDARDVREIDSTVGPQIELPESACPRGLFRPYIPRPNGSTSHSLGFFVPYLTELRAQVNADEMDLPPGFDEAWLEPLDARGYLVDMSGEHIRNTRLTVEQAWFLRYRNGEQTGILRPYEGLTRARYASCVFGVASDLHADGLLTDEALDWYVVKGLTDEIMVDSAPLAIADCRQGGWENLGFRNEGQCVRHVRTGDLP